MFTRKEDELEGNAYTSSGSNYKSSDYSSSSSESSGNAESNLISKGTVLQGDLLCDGDVRIEGEVKGTIRSRSKVVVGQSGFVDGDVECVQAEVLGHVKGSLKVQDNLFLRSNAKMEGDVLTTHFQMEPSVKFNGKCTMQDKVELSSFSSKREEKPSSTPVTASKTFAEKPTSQDKTNGEKEKEHKVTTGIFQKQAV